MGYSKAQVITVGAVLGPIPTVVVLLRFWSRRLIHAKIGPDDWLIVGALVLNYGVAAALIMMAKIGALGQHQKLDLEGQQYMYDEIVHYNQGNYVIQILSIFTIGLAKLSILFLYRRIFLVSRLRTLLNAYIWIIIAWILAFGLSTIFECNPIQYAWTQLESTKYFYCVDLKKYFNALSISDALTDVIIMVLPLPVILRMKMPLRQKIAIAAIFVMGAGVLAISLARLVIFMRIGSEIMFHWNEWTYYVTPTHLWTLAEGTLAVISASLPALKPLLVGPSKSMDREETSYPSFPSKPIARVVGYETDSTRSASKPTDTPRSESLTLPEFVTMAQV